MSLTQRIVEQAESPAEQVVLHGLWRMSRGKQPSMTYKNISNSRKAFQHALDVIGCWESIRYYWRAAQHLAQDEDTFYEALDEIDAMYQYAQILRSDSGTLESATTIARIPFKCFGIPDHQVEVLRHHLRTLVLKHKIHMLREYHGDDLDFLEILYMVGDWNIPLEQVGTSITELTNLARSGVVDTVNFFLELPPHGTSPASIDELNARLKRLSNGDRDRLLCILCIWKIKIEGINVEPVELRYQIV
jgi:hypothetical protein